MAKYWNGRYSKIELGTYVISKMGTISFQGWTNDVVETTSFQDMQKHFELTMQGFGTIVCTGFYDPSDTNAQASILTAFLNQSKLTNISIYLDSTSYYCADYTNDTQACLIVSSMSPIDLAANNLARVTYTFTVSGLLALH